MHAVIFRLRLFMLCEKCQESEAEVHVMLSTTQDSQTGLRQENHLCPRCANVVLREMGLLELQQSGTDSCATSEMISENLRVIRHEPEGWTILEVLHAPNESKSPRNWRIRTQFIPKELRQIGMEFTMNYTAEELKRLKGEN